MTKLISLSDHNTSILRSWHDPFLNESRPNGISCEKCGKELSDTNPSMVIKDRHPLMKDVHCRACGWRGERLC